MARRFSATRAGIHSIFGMTLGFPATRAGIHSIFGMTLYSSPLEGRWPQAGGVLLATLCANYPILHTAALRDRRLSG